jgi:hypothetical protein
VLPSFEKTVEWWMFSRGSVRCAITSGFAGSLDRSHICVSVRHAAAASLRSANTVTSWQPTAGLTLGLSGSTRAPAGSDSGTSTTEILPWRAGSQPAAIEPAGL